MAQPWASAVLRGSWPAPPALTPRPAHTQTRWKQEEKRHMATGLAPKGGTSSSPSGLWFQVRANAAQGQWGQPNPAPAGAARRWLCSSWLESVSLPVSQRPAVLSLRGRHGMPTRRRTQTPPQRLHPRHAAGLRAAQRERGGGSWRDQSSTQYCYCAKWELYSLLWVFFLLFVSEKVKEAALKMGQVWIFFFFSPAKSATL